MTQGPGGTNNMIDRGTELLAVWVILTSFLGLLLALIGHFAAPQIMLASLLGTGVYAWRTQGDDVGEATGAAPDWRHLAFLTLLCLFFRVPAYHYVLGGQDEGVYVNMAHHIANTGGIEVRDTVLARLEGTSVESTYLKDNRASAFLPGVYLTDRGGPRLEFQFYHLFPVWMAFFEGLFGAASGVYALTFFGWLSVVLFYRLALVISQKQITALIAGVLLALNPLHAFFSKFPVTEVVALAFSLLGFTCLLFNRRQQGSASGARWLWLSAASFGCLFVTRISGFMYVPFVLVAAMASAVADDDPRLRRTMFTWSAGVIALYALSVEYGLHWSGLYSRDIYRLSFERLFQEHWGSGVAVCSVIGLCAWLAVFGIARSERRRTQMKAYLLEPGRSAVSLAVVLSLLVGLLKIYQLGWTDRFLPDPWLGHLWHLAGQGWHSAKASSLFALLVYLGPLSLLGLAALVRRQQDPRVEFLRVFAAGFFVYGILLQWTVPYGPYYARYLLSEIVPYLSLLVALVWVGRDASGGQKAVRWLLGSAMLYMALASTAQIGKAENAGVATTLDRLMSPVDADDVVLIMSLGPGRPSTDEIKTPLIYTLNRQVVTVSNSTLSDRAYLRTLREKFASAYLLSIRPSAPIGFELVRSGTVKVSAFARTHLFPSRLTVDEKKLYLFRWAYVPMPIARVQTFGTSGIHNAWLARGWSAPEAWGTWSLGNYAELRLEPRELALFQGGVRLHIEANALVTAKHPLQRVAASLNGTTVATASARFPRAQVSIDVDIPDSLAHGGRSIAIGLSLPDAVSPLAIGMSPDARVLGIGLKSVTALPLGPAK